MNWKAKGEKGQRIAIGILAKFDIDVAIPLSDNLPYDLVICRGSRLLRAQIKSSEGTQNGVAGSTIFSLTTNNWYSNTRSKYDESKIDVMLLCDYHDLYLLGPEEFSGRSAFSIRKTPSASGQKKLVHMHNDYVISEDRIRRVLDAPHSSVVTPVQAYIADAEKRIEPPTAPTALPIPRQLPVRRPPARCLQCPAEFIPRNDTQKYCSSGCWQKRQCTVQRPGAEELRRLLDTTSCVAIGRQFGVSDNAVRKWAKSYGLTD